MVFKILKLVVRKLSETGPDDSVDDIKLLMQSL